jgi:hypothetical protein
MNETRDPLFAALAGSAAPPLPEALAARSVARSRAHLETTGRSPRRERPEPRLAPRLVPALLGASALVFAVDACIQLARIFGRS